jgi:ABC-type nickel/cobalt efflux system permease component RcnA
MSLSALLLTALSLGLVHTLIGPDHYLPFIVLPRAEGWTLRKTLFWTALCGAAHVLSSVVLGLLGVGLGWAVGSMEQFEGIRGALAAYALIGFGSLYFLWGLWRGWRQGHLHLHVHSDGSVHKHAHQHQTAPREGHEDADHDDPDHVAAHQRTLWTLMIIFVLGPCEPLVPLLMVPAAEHGIGSVALVAAVFGGVTVGTMLVSVALGSLGVGVIRFQALERYVHAAAGFTLMVSGLLTQVLGI